MPLFEVSNAEAFVLGVIILVGLLLTLRPDRDSRGRPVPSRAQRKVVERAKERAAEAQAKKDYFVGRR